MSMVQGIPLAVGSFWYGQRISYEIWRFIRVTRGIL